MVPRNRAALVISSCVEKKPSRDLFVSKQALCSLCLYLNPSFSFLLTSPLPFFLYTPRNLWLLLCICCSQHTFLKKTFPLKSHVDHLHLLITDTKIFERTLGHSNRSASSHINIETESQNSDREITPKL